MSTLFLKDLKAYLKAHSQPLPSKRNSIPFDKSGIFKALQIFLEDLSILNEIDLQDQVFDEHFFVSENIWFSNLHDLISKTLFENYPGLKSTANVPKKPIAKDKEKIKKMCSITDGVSAGLLRSDSRFNSLTLLNLGEGQKSDLKRVLQNKRIFCEEFAKLCSVASGKAKSAKMAKHMKKDDFVEFCLMVNTDNRENTLKRRLREFRSEITSFVAQLGDRLGTRFESIKEIFW